MKNTIMKLMEYPKVLDLNPPVSDEIASVVGDGIPAPLMELYHQFNGGEIFVPGTTIYGLTGGKDDVLQINQSQLRKVLNIPDSYLIFAKLNFGDYICINTDEPYDLIQWDHETDEEFNGWDSLEEWLEESIADYSDYVQGDR